MAETVSVKQQKIHEGGLPKAVDFLEQVMRQIQTEMTFNGATTIHMPAAHVFKYRQAVNCLSEHINVESFQITLRRMSGEIMHKYHSPLRMHVKHFEEVLAQDVWKEIHVAKKLKYCQRLEQYLSELQQLFPNLGSITLHDNEYCGIRDIHDAGMINWNRVKGCLPGDHYEEHRIETFRFGDICHYESKTLCRWHSDQCFLVRAYDNNSDIFRGLEGQVYLSFEIGLPGPRLGLYDTQQIGWRRSRTPHFPDNLFHSENVVILETYMPLHGVAKEGVHEFMAWSEANARQSHSKQHEPFTFTASSFDRSQSWTVAIVDRQQKQISQTISVFLDRIKEVSHSQTREKFTRAWQGLREFDPDGEHPIYQGKERVSGSKTMSHYARQVDDNNIEWTVVSRPACRMIESHV